MKLVVDFILVIGILLSILPIVGILRLKERAAPQYILIIFWALILNVVVYFYATLHELSILQFVTNYLQSGVRFLIPPLMYVYVKSIFVDRSTLIRSSAKHFIVFFIFFLAYVIPKSINPYTEYIDIIHTIFPNWAVIQDIFGIVYFLLALKLFYKFRGLMKQNYSRIEEQDFYWVEKFLLSFLMVLTVDLIITFVEIYIGVYVDWDAYITVAFLVVAIAYIGYYGLTQSSVFLPRFLVEEVQQVNEQDQPSATYLKAEEKEELKTRFDRCMQEEKLFLVQGLSLKSLATSMDIPERKLSAFFSEALGSNFYDTINSYRVEEAKRVLRSDTLKQQSIAGIALSCGFSSKSSFYRIFKKATNMSPTAYVATTKVSHSQ
ncbi:MAG: helix-turn-helix domain-containing protein [Bacteroidota bacterium]